jgi:hypothetical protein
MNMLRVAGETLVDQGKDVETHTHKDQAWNGLFAVAKNDPSVLSWGMCIT